jgi:hypothetical protein
MRRVVRHLPQTEEAAAAAIKLSDIAQFAKLSHSPTAHR